MSGRADALVIGAGPAGAATAILLASAGWQVVLVEQDAYPRRKVCGECITPAALALLDQLGIGAGVAAPAGPELRHIGWMSASATLVADFPACESAPYRYGRALRRDFLDRLLVDRALALGVTVMQPARVHVIRGTPGTFQCDIGASSNSRQTVDACVVIDAHGSWQRGPRITRGDDDPAPRKRKRPSDLFAFKAVFSDTRLAPGLLPVIALAGVYGGMVIADDGQATLACCMRRDVLSACRIAAPHASAGDAVEMHLRRHCMGVREALDGAVRDGPWLTVGPLQPGVHHNADGLFRVGNAAAETHPLIGEGIAMALQSAALLATTLAGESPAAITPERAGELQRRHADALHRAFRRRRYVASAYARIAMRPTLSWPARAMIAQWPALLAVAARLAGKTRDPVAAPLVELPT